jgi:hypothetical protein
MALEHYSKSEKCGKSPSVEAMGYWPGADLRSQAGNEVEYATFPTLPISLLIE